MFLEWTPTGHAGSCVVPVPVWDTCPTPTPCPFWGVRASQIKRGAVLAKHIRELSVNNVQRWEILADFWAEMMLFVTPSNDTTVHAE